VLSAVTGPLSDANVPILNITTNSHSYILVRCILPIGGVDLMLMSCHTGGRTSASRCSGCLDKSQHRGFVD